MIRIGIMGAGGRMGAAIVAAARDRDDVVIVAEAPDLYIDFSAPQALAGHLATAIHAATPIVIGTTGLDAEQDRLIDAAAARVAVLQAANMSLGVTLLAHLVRETAARLGVEWDIEVVEMHHRHKRDAPSGTGLLLGAAAAAGRGVDLATVVERGRDGGAARAPGGIGLAALRGGTVAGDHQVIFAGEGERIELAHRAESRAVFAEGAIKAALWLRHKPAGRYTMDDVLELR